MSHTQPDYSGHKKQANRVLRKQQIKLPTSDDNFIEITVSVRTFGNCCCYIKNLNP